MAKKKVHKFPTYWILGSFLIFGFAMMGFSWFLFGSAPKQDPSQEANIQLEAQVEDVTADSLTLHLTLQNEMAFPVEDVALVLEWPAGFFVKEIIPSSYTYKERLRQIDIGTLSSKEKRTVEIAGFATGAMEKFALPVKLGYQSQQGIKQETISVALPALHPESQMRLEMPAMAPIQGRIPFTIWFDTALAQSGMQIQITKPLSLELIDASIPFNEDTLFVDGELKEGKITGSFFANTTKAQRVGVTFDAQVVRLGKSIIAKSMEAVVQLFNSGLVAQTYIDGMVPQTVGLEVGKTHSIGIRITNKGVKPVTHARLFVPFLSSVLESKPPFYDETKKGFSLNEQTHVSLAQIDPGETVEVTVDVPILSSFDPVQVFAGGQEQIMLNTILGYDREGQSWQQQVTPVIIKFSSDLRIGLTNDLVQGDKLSLEIQNAINWVDDVEVELGWSGATLKTKSVWKGKGAEEKGNTLLWHVGMVSPGKPLIGLRLEFNAPVTMQWISWSGTDRHTGEKITGVWGVKPVTEE